MISKEDLSFWHWLFYGSGGKPGITRLARPGLLLDILIGAVLTYHKSMSPADFSTEVILPASGVFFAVAVAWAGNNQSITVSNIIVELSKHNKGGIQDYIFPFQLGLLVILSSLVFWFSISAGLIEISQRGDRDVGEWSLVILMYALVSLNIRIVWKIVQLVSRNLIMIAYLKKKCDESNDSKNDNA